MFSINRAALAFLACSLVGRDARADSVDVCVRAATDGQSSRDAGKLLRARASFARCVDAMCPGQIRRDCNGWLADVESRMPSLVVRVVSADGRDVLDAHATLDGVPVALDGRALEVDPGVHIVAAQIDAGRKGQATVRVGESERRRVVTVAFEPVLAPVRPASHTAANIFLVGAGIGLATAAIFGGLGAREWSSLHDGCRPNCSDADVGSLRTKFLVADVALGVSVLALGISAILWLTARTPDATAGRKP